MLTVPPEGPTNTPLLAIVGEAPGLYEIQKGRPFVGPSGRLLDEILSRAGVRREECYITNLSKTRPPRDEFRSVYYENNRFPKPELWELHKALVEELRAVNPRLVLALGHEALFALTGKTSIKNYRGTLLECNGFKILPTYHPAYILRGMYEDRPILEADVTKAIRLANKSPVFTYHFNTNPSYNEICALLSSRPKRVALDIETINLETRMIGLAWSKTDAMVIPLFRARDHRWTLEGETEILSLLASFLRDPSIEKVLQNFSFDYHVLARDFGFEIRSIVFDTMLAHHLLFPELPKGLDFLCSIYTDHPMYWDYNAEQHDSTARYCCMDCIVTYEVAEILEKELAEQGLQDFYQNLLLPTAKALLRIQSRGVLIDEPLRQTLRQVYEKELGEIEERLSKAVGYTLNPSSPKQVSELLYEKWKLPRQYNRQTGKVTTDDDSLRALSRKDIFPLGRGVINDILLYRQKRVTLTNSLSMPLLNQRVYTAYNVAGTVTGRLTSRATIDDLGGNLQNVPKGEIRKVFIPDHGKVLIKADLSQAEYRVLIWKARISRVIDRWQKDPTFNIHMWNASENIYRVPISEVTKEMYQNAKNGVYAANYGVGPHKISKMYGLDFQVAKFIIERYHEAVPEIKTIYQQEIIDELHHSRTLTNPLGRRRVFFGRLDDQTYRAAFSHYCQSTVADLINSALCELEFSGVEVLLQVHDELVVQCSIDDVESTIEKVRKAMERELYFPNNPIPLVIPAEIKLGPSWGEVYSLDEWRSKWKNGTS